MAEQIQDYLHQHCICGRSPSPSQSVTFTMDTSLVNTLVVNLDSVRLSGQPKLIVRGAGWIPLVIIM